MPFFPFTYNTHPHSILTLAPQVLTAALEGSLYPLSDVVTSDIQLGEDPLDRSCKPTPKKVSDGFKLNMKLIEYLLVSNFQLVILCVGMTASVELTDILNKKQGCLATSTYHPVLVASDTRNEVTSAAARLTLAAGARLTRLALDATLNSESEAPGLLDIFSTLMDSKDKAKETLTSSRLAGQVKEIYEHEVATVEKFKVVMRSNGRRFTVTPRVIANMKSLHATNRLTRPPDLSSNYHTSFRYYKCPSGVIWCNGKSQCCMECRDAFQRPSHYFEKKAAAEVRAIKPHMDYNCPYGSAWCNCRSLLCPNCLKDKGWSSQKEQRDAARALKTESLKELQARRSSAGKKPAAPGSL